MSMSSHSSKISLQSTSNRCVKTSWSILFGKYFQKLYIALCWSQLNVRFWPFTPSECDTAMTTPFEIWELICHRWVSPQTPYYLLSGIIYLPKSKLQNFHLVLERRKCSHFHHMFLRMSGWCPRHWIFTYDDYVDKRTFMATGHSVASLQLRVK